MNGLIIEYKVARKEYPCTWGDDTIKVGEPYIDEILAPWVQVADGTDADGNTTSTPAGAWTHYRSHARCRARSESV